MITTIIIIIMIVITMTNSNDNNNYDDTNDNNHYRYYCYTITTTTTTKIIIITTIPSASRTLNTVLNTINYTSLLLTLPFRYCEILPPPIVFINCNEDKLFFHRMLLNN